MKLQRGSVVEFGNGKRKTITDIQQHTHPHYQVLLTFNDGTKRSYMKDGKHHYGTQNHDIVKIE